VLSKIKLCQVNNGVSNLAIISFAFIFLFLASPDIGKQDSDAASKEFPSQRESMDISNSATNKFSTSMKSTEEPNFTSITRERSIDTMPSFNAGTDNQILNQSEGESKQRLSLQEKFSKGIITNNTIFIPRIYQVTVIFDSITVHNDHEGALSGDGEYDLVAFVQGIKVGLTDASYTKDICFGWFCNTGPALLDVGEGDTLYFIPGTGVTVNLPETTPLSIFTLGRELDSCAGMDYQLPKGLVEIFKNPQLDWLTPITQYISSYNSNDCGYNDSEFLGNIVKFYNPPGQSYEPIGYGAGAHTNVVSSKGDYTLRYTIFVTPPPPPPTVVQKQIDPNKLQNQLQSNNMNNIQQMK